MPLNDNYPLAVTFIVEPRRQDDGTIAAEPIGTGFIVNVPSRVEGVFFEYVITASHVVDGERETYVRIRTRDGGSRDLRVHEWLHHPHGDVAAAPLLAQGYEDLHLLNIPAASLHWARIGDWRPSLGDRVYFLGLLALPAARRITEGNVPMVRSGTIGALYQEHVPVEWPDGSVRTFQAHLIDCRSHGGFSGSPCFFQRDDKLTGISEGVQTRGQVTNLLGLVSGHFDAYTSPRLTGDLLAEGSIKVPVNTGVGIVTPAERIVEVLQMDEFKDERQRITRERAELPEEGATLDDVGEDEFDRFERLTRKLVNTPKPEKQDK